MKVFKGIDQQVHFLLDRASLALSETVFSSKTATATAAGSQANSENISTATSANSCTVEDSGVGLNFTAPRDGTDTVSSASFDSSRGYLCFDGAWGYLRRNAGGGALLLDQGRSIICGKAMNIKWGNRAKEIEAIALEMGIDMALEKGITNLIVESDAEILINQISGSLDVVNSDGSPVKDILDHIKTKTSVFSSIHWKWVPRDCNVRTHKLASLGLSLTDFQFWESYFPAWLVPPCNSSRISSSVVG